jgi:broad specificity phosphatase PhoE
VRVVAALFELAAAHENEQILAVSHGGPVRAAFALADEISHAEARRRGPVVANVFVARFAVEDGKLRRVH